MVERRADLADAARNLADLERQLAGGVKGGSGYSGGIAALPSIREGLTAAGEGTVSFLDKLGPDIGTKLAGLASFAGEMNPAGDFMAAVRGSGRLAQGILQGDPSKIAGGGSEMAGGIGAAMLPGSYGQYAATAKLLPAMFLGASGVSRLNVPKNKGIPKSLEKAERMESKAAKPISPDDLTGTPEEMAHQMMESPKVASRDHVLNENIRKETGWFRAQDGRWRYEIPDTAENFNVKDPGEVAAFENSADASRQALPEGTGSMDQGDWTGAQLEHSVITERALANRKAAKTIRPGHYTHKIDDPETRTTWSDFFSFPELEKAYPGIKDLDLDITILPPGSTSNYSGVYHPPFQATAGKIIIRSTLKDLRSVVAHEAQHFVQSQEAFARGMSPQHVVDNQNLPQVQQWIQDAGPELRDLIKTNIKDAENFSKRFPRAGDLAELKREQLIHRRAEEGRKQAGTPKSSEAYPDREIEGLTKKDRELADKIFKLRKDGEDLSLLLGADILMGRERTSAGLTADSIRVQWVYAKHAGEIEARRVQKRLDYTPEQRLEESPFKRDEYYGVPILPEKQLMQGIPNPSNDPRYWNAGGPVYASELLHMAEGGPPKIPDLTSVPGGKREGVPDSEASQSTIKRRLALEKQQLSELLGKPVKRDVTRALEKGIQSLLDKDPLSGKRAQRMSDRIKDLKGQLDPHPFLSSSNYSYPPPKDPFDQPYTTPTLLTQEAVGPMGLPIKNVSLEEQIRTILERETLTPKDTRDLDQWLKDNYGKGLLDFKPLAEAPGSRPKDPLNLPAILSKTAALAAFDEPRPKGKGQRFRGIGSLMRRRLFPLIQAAQLGYEHLLSPEQKAEIKDFLESPAHEMVGMDKPGIEYFKDLLGVSETEPQGEGVGSLAEEARNMTSGPRSLALRQTDQQPDADFSEKDKPVGSTLDLKTRDYWDEHLEYNVIRRNPKDPFMASTGWILEAAGDVIREMTGQTGFTHPNGGTTDYIAEKLDRIESAAAGEGYQGDRGLVFGDRLEITDEARRMLERIQDDAHGIPVSSEPVKTAKEIVLSVITGSAKSAISHVRSLREQLGMPKSILQKEQEEHDKLYEQITEQIRREEREELLNEVSETPTNKAHGGPVYASEALHMQGGGAVVDIGASDPNRLDMADVEYTMPLWERIKEDPIALMAYDPRNITNIPGRNPGFSTPLVRRTKYGQDVRGYYSPWGPHEGTIAIHPAFTFPKSEKFREYDKGYYTGEHSFEDYYPKDVDIKEIAQFEGLDTLIHELRHKGLYDLVFGEGPEKRLSSDEQRMFLTRLLDHPDSPLSHEARVQLQTLKDLSHYPHGEDTRTGVSLKKHLRSHPFYGQDQRKYRQAHNLLKYEPRWWDRRDSIDPEHQAISWYQTDEGRAAVDQHEEGYARAQSIALERIAKRWPGWNYEVPEDSPYRSATSTGVGITEPRLSDVLKKEYDEEQKYQQRIREKAHGGPIHASELLPTQDGGDAIQEYLEREMRKVNAPFKGDEGPQDVLRPTTVTLPPLLQPFENVRLRHEPVPQFRPSVKGFPDDPPPPQIGSPIIEESISAPVGPARLTGFRTRVPERAVGTTPSGAVMRDSEELGVRVEGLPVARVGPVSVALNIDLFKTKEGISGPGIKRTIGSQLKRFGIIGQGEDFQLRFDRTTTDVEGGPSQTEHSGSFVANVFRDKKLGTTHVYVNANELAGKLEANLGVGHKIKFAEGGLASMAPEARAMFGKPHSMDKEPRLTDLGPGAIPGVAGLCGVARNMNRSVVA